MRKVLVLACMMAVACSSLWAQADEPAANPIGKKIANFTLPDSYGRPQSLASHDGKLVVLAFLGTECPLARSYAPRLRELAAEFKDQGVVFLGIDSNMQDSLTDIAEFAKAMELSFPLLKDNNNVLADQVGAVRTPEVVLLDKDRVIRYQGRIDDQYGFKTGAGYVRPILKERNLADAIGEVLAGKDVSRAVVKADGCFIGRVTKVAPTGEVTYSKHIAKVMQDRCVECHRTGEVAPFTLTSYDDVLGWSETIREVVNEGRMPPWFADPRFGHFTNDARLSENEKQLVNTWVANGCPQGDSKDLPEPRQFATGWQIGEPDEVFYMSQTPFRVPATGTLPYKFYTVDPGWKTDRWIRATESRPGNRAVVHHIIVSTVAPGARGGGLALQAGGGLGGYAPGMTPTICPPGTAIFVPAGSKLSFQMHYTTNGVEQDDISMIGVCYADPATVKQAVKGGQVGDLTFRIPAGNPNFEVKAKKLFAKDTLLLNMTPHMHLRGKSFRFEAEYPDGTREVLLDVPNYDFNWQLKYMLAEPKLLPKGTWLHGIASFDNSAENSANPDPTRNVTWGEQTWDEMMFGFYSAIDPAQDLTTTDADKGPGLEAGETNGFVGEGSVTGADALRAVRERMQDRNKSQEK